MTEREDFEDGELIDRYRAAIPRPDTAYRATLWAQLAATPAPRRFRLLRRHWQWTTGASLALAVTVALALLALPLGPHHESPLSPRAVLARALDATVKVTPYRATAALSFVSAESDAPPSTMKDLGTHRILFQSAVRDSTHWRVDIDDVQPALQSNEQVAVADGSSLTWYQSITNRAVQYPLTPPQWGGVFLGIMQGGQVVPLGQTLEQYVQELNNPRTGTHARSLGQETVLGRAADVIEVWPLGRENSGSCNSAAQCLKNSHGYGCARLWIDHQHGLVLRYQQFDMPAQNSDAPQEFVYQVTSVSFGSGATATELAYHPPVRPRLLNPLRGIGVDSASSGSSGGPRNQRWHAPGGFLSAGAPRAVHGTPFVLTGSGSGQDPTFGADSANATFRLGALPPSPQPPTAGPFLYIQEQYRVTGLPAGLTAGARRRAGACTVHTGSYADGLHWLALARRNISLLAVSDTLDAPALVRWAATQVCP